jgi:hypothetical protein
MTAKKPLDEKTALATSERQIAQFREALDATIAHCRKYPAAKGKRTITVKSHFKPDAADPDDQSLDVETSYKLPQIPVPTVPIQSNGRKQAKFQFMEEQPDLDTDN